MTRDNAIAAVIKTCIDEDVLKEFLTERYAEVLKMLNWEYDAEAERRVLDQEARQEGRQEAATQMLKLLQEGMSHEDAFKQVTERATDTLPQ